MTPQHPAAPEGEGDVRLTERHVQDFAVTIAALLAGRCDGQQAVATTVAQVERILTERLRVVEGERDAARAESDARVEGNDYMHRALSQAKDRENLRLAARAESAEAAHEALRAERDALRSGISALGESIHGDEGVEHIEGCEGEPTCFACILDSLRALLPTSDREGDPR